MTTLTPRLLGVSTFAQVVFSGIGIGILHIVRISLTPPPTVWLMYSGLLGGKGR